MPTALFRKFLALAVRLYLSGEIPPGKPLPGDNSLFSSLQVMTSFNHSLVRSAWKNPHPEIVLFRENAFRRSRRRNSPQEILSRNCRGLK